MTAPNPFRKTETAAQPAATGPMQQTVQQQAQAAYVAPAVTTPATAADAFGADAFEDDEDLVESASSTFPKPTDLKDRLCVIYPFELSPPQRGEFNGDYYYVTADVVVLDGPITPNGWFKRLPIRFERMHLNYSEPGKNWHRDLAHLIGKGKPKVGRMQVQPATKNPTKDTSFLRPPSDEDVKVAIAYVKAEKARRESELVSR